MKGWGKVASLKKHISQLSEDETTYLLNKASDIKNWKVSRHLIERLEERGGNKNTVLETIKKGNLIEYHQRNGTSRILMRGTETYNNDVACVVFQFDDSKIITMYWNNKDDNHRTLKEEAYDEKLDVIKMVIDEEKFKRKQHNTKYHY